MTHKQVKKILDKMSAKVCRNPNIKLFYMDQIDERNQVEKAQFRDIFTEYMELMDSNGML